VNPKWFGADIRLTDCFQILMRCGSNSVIDWGAGTEIAVSQTGWLKWTGEVKFALSGIGKQLEPPRGVRCR